MNHPAREEWMSYLYDELTAEEHSSLAAHLAVCPDCTTRVSDWRAARTNLDAWQLPARLARVPLQRPLVRWAAAAALMIGFGFGVGRFATPATANAGKIRAAIEPEIRQQLRQEFTLLLREELDKAASATLAASGEQTKHWVEAYARAFEAKRAQDRQAIDAALDNMESQRVADFASLKKDVAAVAVWTDTDLRRTQEQLAKAQQAIELAQAAAPAAPRASAGTAATPAPAPAPAPALSQRLQAIVSKGRGGPGKALVIRTSDADAKAQANLEEDLAVMSRILDKTVAKKLDDDRGNRFMGINVLFAPGSGSISNLHLEEHGALFMLKVNFHLLPPPEKAEPTKEKSEADSTWEEAKQELYGRSDAWALVDKGFKFSTAAGPQQEYDKDKVEDLKESLLDALKNATNIRNVKTDESITVC